MINFQYFLPYCKHCISLFYVPSIRKLPYDFMEGTEHTFSSYMFDLGDGGRYVVDDKYNSK